LSLKLLSTNKESGEDEIDNERNPNEDNSEGHQEYNDQRSHISRQNTETIGEDSLPDIDNSVVEDSLPFRGLENHYMAISKEGFSGANNTNQMKKTNENFYSSFKSKGNENEINQYKDGNYPNMSSKGNNQSEIHEYYSSDLGKSHLRENG